MRHGDSFVRYAPLSLLLLLPVGTQPCSRSACAPMAFHGAAAKLGSMLSTPRSPSRRQSVSLPESAYVDAEEQMLHENAELVRAAKRGDLSAVQRQWKVLPGPNAFYKDGRDKYTLLHLACNHGTRRACATVLTR